MSAQQAQEVVEGFPDEPQGIEDFLMSLGNSRVEVLARKFFRPMLVPYRFPEDYEEPVICFERMLGIHVIEFVKGCDKL